MNNRLNIIIACHGDLGKSLRNSAELIVGKIENIYSFSLEKGVSLEELIKSIESLLVNLEGDTIILTDLNGGTPDHASVYLQTKYNCNVISGVNIPILLELVTMRDQAQCTIEDLLSHLESVGKAGIKCRIKKN